MPSKVFLTKELFYENGDSGTYAFPATREKCDRCDGTGAMVNPAIDGNGITSAQFAEDPDFGEAYFRGDYDVICEDCKGEKIILVIDRKKSDSKMLGLLDEMNQVEWEIEAERVAERRALGW